MEDGRLCHTIIWASTSCASLLTLYNLQSPQSTLPVAVMGLMERILITSRDSVIVPKDQEVRAYPGARLFASWAKLSTFAGEASFSVPLTAPCIPFVTSTYVAIAAVPADSTPTAEPLCFRGLSLNKSDSGGQAYPLSIPAALLSDKLDI